MTGTNLFTYCGNNPVTRFDYTGHSWKSFWEDTKDWFEEHWVEVAVGTAFIVGGAVVTALTCGAGTAAWAAFGSALLSSTIQVGGSIVVGVGINGINNLKTGEQFFGNVGDTIASSYMWGGIFAGSAQIVGGAFRFAANNGVPTGRKAGIKLGNSNTTIFSPDRNNWPKAGGTLIKFGGKVRVDIGAHWGLHLHLFNWPPHIPIGSFIAGEIGSRYRRCEYGKTAIN